MINYITNTGSYKEAEKTLDEVKTKRKYYNNKFQFFDTAEKN